MHGLNPVIFSKKQKSVIYGAQYLHMPIPGITRKGDSQQIHTFRVGLERNYAQRVYNDAHKVTSWRKVEPVVRCWDLRQSYDAAWEKFDDRIIDWDIGLDDIYDFTSNFEMVVSTIPLWAICRGNHEFKSIPIVVRKSHKEFKYNNPLAGKHGARNWVLYNGWPEGYWYRASYIFGHPSIEAPAKPQPPGDGWEPGFKVAGNNCDCHPNVIRAGRMGTWERGILTHHAFTKVVESITETFGLVLSRTAGSD